MGLPHNPTLSDGGFPQRLLGATRSSRGPALAFSICRQCTGSLDACARHRKRAGLAPGPELRFARSPVPNFRQQLRTVWHHCRKS